MSDDGSLIALDRTPSPQEEAFSFLTPEERKAIELSNRLKEVEIEDKTQDRDLRRTYANRILIYLAAYSGVVGVLLVLHGWKIGGFTLESEIVATLVGSTAVAAIGLVGFIAVSVIFRPRQRARFSA